jgi:CRISPR-associated protein Csb2
MASPISLARFALDGPSLPLLTDTLPLAEAVRRALMGVYQRTMHHRQYGTADKPYREQFRSPTLSGKDEAGTPLVEHAHAYYLPADEDGDGRLDHVTIVAAKGFTSDEIQALSRLRSVRFGAGESLAVQLVGLGSAADFRTPLLASAATWVSATPFVVTRYPKRNGRKRDQPADYATPQTFARCVLREELDRLRQRRPELPPVLALDLLETLGPQGRYRCLQFQRIRAKPGDDGGRRPTAAFRITFAASADGPLCLGHASHFGLGLFVPERGPT